MKNGKEFAEKMFSEMENNNNNEVQEKLYSTGNDELDNLLEKAYNEGYEAAQKEFSEKDPEEGKNHRGLGRAAVVGGAAGVVGRHVGKKATEKALKEGESLSDAEKKGDKKAVKAGAAVGAAVGAANAINNDRQTVKILGTKIKVGNNIVDEAKKVVKNTKGAKKLEKQIKEGTLKGKSREIAKDLVVKRKGAAKEAAKEVAKKGGKIAAITGAVAAAGALGAKLGKKKNDDERRLTRAKNKVK